MVFNIIMAILQAFTFLGILRLIGILLIIKAQNVLILDEFRNPR